jgi:hypothetical protein
MTNYIFHTQVLSVEEKTRIARAWKVGADVKTETESLGWFVMFGDSGASLYFGHDKPDLVVGQNVTITIRSR